MVDSDNSHSPVLHVVVVGFHHKKGCQVEFSFPPLIPGNSVDSREVPIEWKHLASLAIPDGAHNYTEDTIFFHLPGRENLDTVYGVSCYRQMDATELRNRGADVTRNSVQKSVCVLSRLPLYGLIQAKLELITHAYFDERDFSQVSLLEDTYRNLSACLSNSLLQGSQVFLGLSSREMVQHFKHKLLILFKLMMLERRVLFFGSPVKPICTTMLAVLSLFPRLIEYGLEESASYSPKRYISPTMKVTNISSNTDEPNEYLEVHYTETPSSTNIALVEQTEKTVKPAVLTQKQRIPSGDEASKPQDDAKPVSLDEPSPVAAATGPISRLPGSEGKKVSGSSGSARVRKTDSLEGNTSDLPGIHRQSSRESQRTKSFDEIDHPLSAKHQVSQPMEPGISCQDSQQSSLDRSRHKSAPDRERHDSGSKKDKDRHNLERKLEQAATNIDRITHTEPIQDEATAISDEAVLTDNPPQQQKHKKDPLEFVQEITKITPIQKRFHRLSSSGRSSSIPDEDLTPDEKELLGDTDECAFNWQEDKLLLEINEEEGNSHGMSSPPSGRTKPRTGSGKGVDASKPRMVPGMAVEVAALNDPDINATSTGATHSHNLDLDFDMLGGHEKPLGQGQGHPSKTVLLGSKTESKVVDEAHEELWSSDMSRSESKNSVGSRGSDKSASSNLSSKAQLFRSKLSAAWAGNKDDDKFNVELQEIRPLTPTSLNVDEYGFPMAIFTKGMLCHPYLSLQYYDLLQDVNIRGFVVGATNVLYKQKKNLLDVIVDVTGEGKIDIHDQELRKQLNLTTADLRFADDLVKATVTDDASDLFLDDTSWEGGDEWLRGQFRHYMLSLLVASKSSDEKVQEDFNLNFITAWKTTHNYKLWCSTRHIGMVDVSANHPCQGQVTVADMKLKLTHSLSNTERGKKVNAAMATTGKVVLQTGKAVGGAITSAKSAVSSWFSSWRQPSQDKGSVSPSDSPSSPVENDNVAETKSDTAEDSTIEVPDDSETKSDEISEEKKVEDSNVHEAGEVRSSDTVEGTGAADNGHISSSDTVEGTGAADNGHTSSSDTVEGTGTADNGHISKVQPEQHAEEIERT